MNERVRGKFPERELETTCTVVDPFLSAATGLHGSSETFKGRSCGGNGLDDHRNTEKLKRSRDSRRQGSHPLFRDDLKNCLLNGDSRGVTLRREGLTCGSSSWVIRS